jgi:hypothetical protein
MVGLVVGALGFVPFVWPFRASLLAALTCLLTKCFFKMERSTWNGAFPFPAS